MGKTALFKVILGIALISFFLCACGDKSLPASESGFSESNIEPEKLPAYRCPLDGAPLDEMPVRPVAIAIDNMPAAWPQSGINQADIVYEIPAEGGITRFLTIYFHGEAEKIGPVRSARPYLMDIAREWEAVFIHCGESPQAQIYFKEKDIDHINEMFHSPGFWRDKSRRAPNNLYTGTKEIWAEIEKKGWDRQVDIEGFHFDDTLKPEENELVHEVTVKYPYRNVIYKYEASSGLYHRFLGSKPQLDSETGDQYSAANILIQEVGTKVFDQEGRMEIDLLGKGNAILFSRGRVFNGMWKKDSFSKRTYFTDDKGEEFRLAPGQTWILLKPKNTVYEYSMLSQENGQ